jgi:hypothetical protein
MQIYQEAPIGVGMGRHSIGGVRIVLDRTLEDHAGWDFSRCRSPSRAERRMKRRGPMNRQIKAIMKPRMTTYKVGDMLVMHPDMYDHVVKQMKAAA